MLVLSQVPSCFLKRSQRKKTSFLSEDQKVKLEIQLFFRWEIMQYSDVSILIFQFAKSHSVLCRLNVKMTSSQKLLKEDAAIFLFVNQNPKSIKAQRP